MKVLPTSVSCYNEPDLTYKIRRIIHSNISDQLLYSMAISFIGTGAERAFIRLTLLNIR